MTDPTSADQSRSSIGQLSRTTVGLMTGAVSRMFGGSTGVKATGRFLRRQIWAWPIIAAVVFGGSGWWVHRKVENAMREQRETDLNVMVNASVEAVKVWVEEEC